MNNMMVYIHILTMALMTTLNISCDKEDSRHSEDFFYGTWSGDIQMNPGNFIWYIDGFELKSQNVCVPRYYQRDDMEWTAVGTAFYQLDLENNMITFAENKQMDENSKTYIFEVISNDEIKLSNVENTEDQYIYYRQLAQ